MEAEALPSNMITTMLIHRGMSDSDASESVKSRLEPLGSKVRCVDLRTRLRCECVRDQRVSGDRNRGLCIGYLLQVEDTRAMK